MLLGSSRPRFGGMSAFPTPEEETQQLQQMMTQPMPGAMSANAPAIPKQDWGDKVGNLGTALMAAQAAIDGDFGSSVQLSGSIGARQRQMQAQMAAQAQQRAREAALMRNGVDAQAAPLLANDETALRTALLPKEKAEDAFTQTLRAAGYDPTSPEAQALYRQRAATMAMPAPSLIGSPDTGYRWAQPPAPSLGGMSAAQSVPTVSDEAGYNALPPGAQYRDPNGNLRTKGGGAGNGAGGFPSNVPSGNPLSPW